MSEKELLLENMAKVHSTELGIKRISRELGLKSAQVVDWCKQAIAAPDSLVIRNGKNWYVLAGDCTLTINASSCTIITAKRKTVEP